MCTVMLRFAPGQRWGLVLAAVRDEFMQRPWDPPGEHWPQAPGVVGGLDRTAGGTWLAVRRDRPAVAALLNGVRLPQQDRPTRGGLPLAALTDLEDRSPDELRRYDGFHLLLCTPDRVQVWSWDGADLITSDLTPGDHIIVNLGVDTVDDPLVPHFAPLLRACPSPGDLRAAETAAAWGGWVELLRGDGLSPDDPRALIERREFAGNTYGSTSASLIALGRDDVRFDFTATPDAPNWGQVDLASG